jgi:hypothetical protein
MLGWRKNFPGLRPIAAVGRGGGEANPPSGRVAWRASRRALADAVRYQHQTKGDSQGRQAPLVGPEFLEVCKGKGEETFAGTRPDDEEAPTAEIGGDLSTHPIQPRGGRISAEWRIILLWR